MHLKNLKMIHKKDIYKENIYDDSLSKFNRKYAHIIPRIFI